MYGRTYGRTDVPTDGRTFPALMLLGRVRGVDLKICCKTELSVGRIQICTNSRPEDWAFAAARPRLWNSLPTLSVITVSLPGA